MSIELPLYQVDAFTQKPFGGNPAAVCLPSTPLDAPLMQAIAAEMNLSETAFPEPADADGVRRLRWFTPTLEMPLCGHATLAAAKALLERGDEAPLRFATLSGELVVDREDDGRLRMDFPAMLAHPAEPPAGLLEALGCSNVTAVGLGPEGQYWLVEVGSQTVVAGLEPDFGALNQIDMSRRVGVAVTAPGDDPEVDFVSRFFAPWAGVDEDPVTGSAHCMLAPWWGKSLGKNDMRALQISARMGDVEVRLRGDRVHLLGHAVIVSSGNLLLPE